MTGAAPATWFPPCRADAAASPVLDADAAQLFCLPHAGAGASVYREWLPLLAPAVEVVPVQLPGRESRHGESPRRSVFDLTAELLGPLADRTEENFALFGHSMGALLGYELAAALSALGRPPRHLFVSGLGAPHLPAARPPAYLLPDGELLALIADLEGTSAEVLAQPELVQLLLPVLRADLEVCETYRHPRRPLLAVPVTALGGRGDPGVSVARLRAWESLTSASFDAVIFQGGHFYLHEQLAELAAVLTMRLREPGAPRRGAIPEPACGHPSAIAAEAHDDVPA